MITCRYACMYRATEIRRRYPLARSLTREKGEIKKITNTSCQSGIYEGNGCRLSACKEHQMFRNCSSSPLLVRSDVKMCKQQTVSLGGRVWSVMLSLERLS